MFLSKPLFSELFGFVVYCPKGLQQYIEQHHLNQNLLEAFTTTVAGDEISAMGVAIPLTELDADDYRFAVSYAEEEPSLLEKHKTIKTIASKQFFHAKEAFIHICGMGYFSNWDPERLVSLNKVIETPIKPGTYNVDVLQGVINKQAMIELRLNHQRPK